MRTEEELKARRRRMKLVIAVFGHTGYVYGDVKLKKSEPKIIDGHPGRVRVLGGKAK